MAKPTITFEQVSSEFRSLVERRRKQVTFLFTGVAAFAVLMDGALHRDMPPAYGSDMALVFIGCGFLILVSLITAAREARLHRGFVYFGMLFKTMNAGRSRIYEGPQVLRPFGVNVFGVSMMFFLLAVFTGLILIASLGAMVGAPSWMLILLAALILVFMFRHLRRQHDAGAAMAMRRASAPDNTHHLQDGTDDQWRQHLLASIDDVHKDMLELIAVAGLATFASSQLAVGFGSVSVGLVSLNPAQLREDGPMALAFYSTAVSLLTYVSYVRLRHALGVYSQELDPTDRAFRPFQFDDSFLGGLLLLLVTGYNLALWLIANRWFSAGSASLLAIAFVVCCTAIERLSISRRDVRARVGSASSGG